MTTDQLTNIFIHGSFANSLSWKKILGEMGQTGQNFAVDLPGHGGCKDPDDFDSPSLEPEITAIKEMLQSTGESGNGVHLIGHSYGGVVSLGAAMQHEIPVKRLTLFEPVDIAVLSVFSEIEAANEIAQFMAEHKEAADSDDAYACERVIDFWGGKGSFKQIPSHIQQQMIPMTKNNMRHWEICKSNGKSRDEYKTLNIPVTLVHGSRSNYVAKSICSSLHRNLPNSKLHIIEGASHFMITSHPKECADSIA